MGDDPIGEYRYTVTHGSDTLRLTGNNLHLVRTAKLVLDEFFSGEKNLNNIAVICTDTGREAIETAECSSRPGDLSSKNRRAQFQKTCEDRANGDDSGPSTPGTTCPTLEAVLDPVPAVPARRCYTRDFLVQCAASPLSRLTPDNWSRVMQQSPVVLKKNWQYLAGVVATLNEKGEAAVNGVPSYLQASDLEDAAVLAKRELRWTLIRTMSTTEEDDNGNNAT
ncbi:Eukaryotic translation initiation factor 4E-binding protein Mextli-like [Homarus americanus]|uniref:Eukaryotic translation initiation factor 4E-binding protein Mextli-like n=2 Tax=Homarus americanus TaxID=6706 RepID=A0A8J5K8V3_HOMAM|nr:Eukaryotic translation initiation factor 4E-binding protein Mextli-like [Homarus americanus]